MKYKKHFLITMIIIGLLFGCSIPNMNKINSGHSNNSGNSDNTDNETLTKNTDKEIIVKISNTISYDEVDKLINGTRVKTITSFNGYSYILYELTGTDSIETTLNKINSFKEGLVLAEKNQIYKMFTTTPNDTYYTNQYAPKITNCETAWDISTGSNAVIVAVIDTGINGYHEELSARVIAGYNCVYSNTISAGTNSDNNGHGTHVAGIIGAAGNNAKGIAGLAWQTRLMPVKVLDSSGKGNTSDIIEGIIWASNNGANVINMSLGGESYSQMMADAVNYAAITKGVTVVVAMGNDGNNVINYPAAYTGVIAVGSTNGRDGISSFSTTGNHISVSAPGENIYSLSYNNNSGYVYMSGTSMASPFVAGIAALLLAKDPTLTPPEIKSILEDSAVDKGTTGFDSTYGYGRVDVASALNLSKRNNYGTIKVKININSTPLALASVLLLNSAGTQTISTGLTSDGSGSGGTNGEFDFNFIRSGSYKVKVIYKGTTQTQNVTLSSGGEQNVIFVFTAPTYTLNATANSPESGTVSLNPAGGIYNEDTGVTLTANANAGYIFDHWGGDLAGSSNPISTAMNKNKIVTAYFKVTGPTISPSGGSSYTADQNITISTIASGTTIRYTTDGSNPTSSYGTIYTGIITITGTTTIKAIAYKSGCINSDVSTATYYYYVATPIFSPSGGSYSTAQDITISTVTSGASIRYTTDGSNPTSSYGTIYTGVINVSVSKIIKAIAYKTGWTDSSIATAAYNIPVPFSDDDFETGNFLKYPWVLSGNVKPIVQSTTKYQGLYSAKFGIITHSQNSSFSITIQNASTDTDTISFYYKVSSESGWDYFKFLVDGASMKSDSGEKDWTFYSYTLSPGIHTLTWQYSKDGSVNSGSDMAWVDSILLN